MLTDDELDQACDVLTEHEGLIPWLYCDTRGFATVGVGDKVSAKNMLTMPFVHMADGKPAEQNEKADAYKRVLDFFVNDLTASGYSAVTDLRLSVDFCRRRLAYRVTAEFVPAIEKKCPQFASFPLGVKLCLVDIAYNVGVDSPVKGFAAFVQLIAACNEGRFDDGAIEVHTEKEGEDPKDPKTWGKRNTWRMNRMLEAARSALA